MNYTNLNKNLNIYLKEIRGIKSLDQEKTKELFTRLANGDKRAESEIFLSMSKYAMSVAKLYTSNPEELEDYIQEANMGLVAAIRKFDVTKGYKLSSFAIYWMKAAIFDSPMMKGMIDNKKSDIATKVTRIENDFLQKNHRMPSEYEVMDILEEQGTPVKDVNMLHRIYTESMDAKTGTDEEGGNYNPYENLNPVDNSYEVEADREELKDTIRKKMSILTEREKKLVSLAFGLGDFEKMEYDAIAERETVDTGKAIGSERVRQIVVGAVKKMQAAA